MNYTTELDFLLKFLKKEKINTHFYHKSVDLTSLDNRLRQLLGHAEEYTRMDHFIDQQIEEHTIYRITDEFSCIYFIMLLPSEEHSIPFIIGPYVHSVFDKASMMHLVELYNISPQTFQTLEETLAQIPILADDSFLHALIQTFGESLWGSINEFHFQFLNQDFKETIFTLLPSEQEQDNYSNFDATILDHYLRQENNLIQAVSQGNVQTAEEIVSSITTFPLSQISAEQLRNMKNYALSINCICRKTAEANSASTYLIVKLAVRFVNKIESCVTLEACITLIHEIVRKYCLLIKNHSMREYSPLIQQAIKQIDMDLTADLSLSAMAKLLNSNASYLSTQFKKTTGFSYTEYVQKKRMEHAILLLNTTSLQVQTIAQYCGINDLNYFSKLFKKYVHSSPTAYRKSLSGLEKQGKNKP